MNGHLEEQLARARIEEMHRYRRDIIYSQLRELISDDRMKILDLVNHGLALVDDELDSSPDPLEKIKHLGKSSRKVMNMNALQRPQMQNMLLLI